MQYQIEDILEADFGCEELFWKRTLAARSGRKGHLFCAAWYCRQTENEYTGTFRMNWPGSARWQKESC